MRVGGVENAKGGGDGGVDGVGPGSVGVREGRGGVEDVMGTLYCGSVALCCQVFEGMIEIDPLRVMK